MSASLGAPLPAAWGDLFEGANGWLALALTGGVGLHRYAWNTTLFVLAWAPPDETGTASAAITTVQRYGMAVGAAVAAWLARRITRRPGLQP